MHLFESDVWSVLSARVVGSGRSWRMMSTWSAIYMEPGSATDGPSVHVNTCEKPQSLTVFSSCEREVVRVDMLEWW
jgi:hypothetical protein